MSRRTHQGLDSFAVVVTVAVLAAAVAAVGVVGADLDWLVPLGAIVAHGHVPSSIPAAAAPTSGWHDAIAGSQLVVWWVYAHLGGERGLVGLQALAAAFGFGTLALGLSRQARDGSGAALLVSTLVLIGGSSTVLVTRVSLFSLALYPLLVVLLEEDGRAPSRRIWLVVPLIAAWANLHGMVLVGAGLVVLYAVVERGRREPFLAAGVAGATIVATCATPQLWNTVLYYRGVLENQAAARGVGLWSPLGFGVFDLLYAGVGLALLICARGRLRPWEWVAVLGLGAASIHSARIGFWLLFVAAFPAVRALRIRAPKPQLLIAISSGLAVTAVFAFATRSAAPAVALARRAAALDGVVLAGDLANERVALYGGRVLVGNPIDAFRRGDQRLYLDWLQGKPAGARAIARASYVLVSAASPAGRAAARDRRLHRLTAAGGEVLYRVR